MTHAGAVLFGLFDREYLVRGETVCLFVDFLPRFFVGTFKQTEHGIIVLRNPVIQVFDSVLFLGLNVFFVGLDNVFDTCVYVSMDVHE